MWPNKKECDKRYGNCSKKPLDLKQATQEVLQSWMPSASLQHHQWKKHGSCQQRSDDEYFLLMVHLATKFDDSALGNYLRANQGKALERSDMQKYLTLHLGEEITKKIYLQCAKKKYLQEIRVHLPKKITAHSTLKELTRGAKDSGGFAGNCAAKIFIERPGPN